MNHAHVHNIAIAMVIAIHTIIGSDYAASQDSTPRNLSDATKRLAPQIVKKIQEQHGKRLCKVCVFSFGEKGGQFQKPQGTVPKTIQAGLIDSLQVQKNASLSVLGPIGLKRLCLNQKVSVDAVTPDEPGSIGEVLMTLKQDVAIVGNFSMPKSSDNLASATSSINATIVYKDGSVLGKIGISCLIADICTQTGFVQKPKDDESPDFFAADLSDRFNIEILVNGKPRQLYECVNAKSQYWKVRFLPLAKVDLHKPFSVRISNRGYPEVKWAHPEDRKRLFGVALLLDGVNSIYHEEFDHAANKHVYGPVIRHPLRLRKWILTGPSTVLRPSNIEGQYTKQPVNGSGHSVNNVRGFQRGTEWADQFVFGRAEDSVAAATLGITNEIGMISAHFYPEHLHGDRPLRKMPPTLVAGTARFGVEAGALVEQKTFVANVTLKKNPVEVWRIFYYDQNENPPTGVGPDDLRPLTQD